MTRDQIIVIINIVDYSIVKHLIHHSSHDSFIIYTFIHVRISTKQRFVLNILRILVKDKTVNKQNNTKQFFVRTQNDQKFQN